MNELHKKAKQKTKIAWNHCKKNLLLESRRPDRVGQRTHWESPVGSLRVAIRQSYSPPAVDPRPSPGSWLPVPHLSSSRQTSDCPWNTLPPYRRKWPKHALYQTNNYSQYISKYNLITKMLILLTL